MIWFLLISLSGVLLAMVLHTKRMDVTVIKDKTCDFTDGHMEFYSDDKFVGCSFLAGRIKIIGDVVFVDCVFYDTRIFFEEGDCQFINCRTASFDEYEGDYKGSGL